MIKKRLRMAQIMVVIVIALMSVLLFNYMKHSLETTTMELEHNLNASAVELIQDEINNIGDNLKWSIVMIEDMLEEKMHNAAVALRVADRAADFDLKLSDMKKLNADMGMDDLYLTDKKGNFTTSTESGAKGENLFDIWDGYKMLVTGEADVLNSGLTVKVETGEVFKFTAIPRADGKGVAESALNAKQFNESIQSFITFNPNINYIMILDAFDMAMISTNNEAQQVKAPAAEMTKYSDEFTAAAFKGERQMDINEQESKIYIPIEKFGKPAYVACISINSAPYFAQSQQALTYLEKLSKTATDINFMAIVIFISVIVVSFGLYGIVFSHKIIKPIEELSDNMRNIAEGEGDLTLRIENVTNNEIGMLATYFNMFIEKIHGTISDVSVITNQVNSASIDVSERLDMSTEKLDAVSKSVDVFAENLGAQAKDIERELENSNVLASEIEDMRVKLSTTQDTSANALAEQEKGKVELDRLKDKNEQANGATAHIAEVVESLADKITEIAGALQNINGIAEQTNLLALNASIESARAGEHGKGFAVVAEEIRKLAEESKHLTEEINHIIDGIKKENDKSLAAMKNLSEISKEQYSALQKVEQSFDIIASQIDDVSDNITVVNHSIDSIDTIKESTLGALQTIFALSQENASSSESVADVTKEQSETLRHIDRLVADLSHNSETLKDDLDKFKL